MRAAAVGALGFGAVCGLASPTEALEHGGQPALADAERGAIDLIVSVRHSSGVLADAIPALQLGDRIYASLDDVAAALEFPIRWSPADAAATGWFLAEGRPFRLDLGAGVVSSDGRAIPLVGGDVLVRDGALFVAIEALGAWFPVSLSFHRADLALDVSCREILPFQARRLRADSRSALAALRSPSIEADALDDLDAQSAATVGVLVTRTSWSRQAGLAHAASAQAVRDVRGTTASAYLSAPGGGAPMRARLRLFREAPNDERLDVPLLPALPVTRWEVGDVASVEMPLGWRGVSGPGFTMSNAPTAHALEFDKLTLRGDAPDGYDVELYRNGLLIDARGDVTGGRYDFTDAPLELGTNDIEIVLYGPQGQKLRRRETIVIGPGATPPGQVRYAVSALAPEARGGGVPESWRGALRLEAGVSRTTTLVAHATTAAGGDQAALLVGAGVRHSFGPVYVRGDLAASSPQALGGSVGAMARWRGVSMDVTSTAFTSRAQQDLRRATPGLARSLEATATFSVGSDEHPTPINLAVRRKTFERGPESREVSLRTSARAARVLLNGGVDVRSAGANGAGLEVSGTLDASRPLLGLSARVSAEMDLTRGVLRRVGSTVDRPLPRGALRIGLDRAMESQRPTASISYVHRIGGGEITLDAAGDVGGRATMVGIGLRVGLAGPAYGDRPTRVAAEPERSGQVFARVFEDRDADGRFGPGDVPLEGVRVRRGGGHDALTDAHGMARFPSVPTDVRSEVALDVGSLSDPFLTPVRPAYAVLARPGAAALAEFPVVATSEVEGMAYLVVDGLRTPLEGVEVLVQPLAGGPALRARTEFDGLFAVVGATPGRYRVGLAPDAAARFGLKAAAVEFDIDAPGDVVRAPALLAQRQPPQTDLASTTDDPIAARKFQLPVRERWGAEQDRINSPFGRGTR